jgi:hypothetical protein
MSEWSGGPNTVPARLGGRSSVRDRSRMDIWYGERRTNPEGTGVAGEQPW